MSGLNRTEIEWADSPPCVYCGSTDTAYTGVDVYQDADPERRIPMIEAEEIGCNNCGCCFWW